MLLEQQSTFFRNENFLLKRIPDALKMCASVAHMMQLFAKDYFCWFSL